MPNRRALTCYAILVALGLAILVGLLRAEPAAGLTLLIAGSAGLILVAVRAVRAARAEEARRRQAAAKKELAEARRERSKLRSAERRRKGAVDSHARVSHQRARRSYREQDLAARQVREQARSSRSEHMGAAAERWQNLRGSDRLCAEVEQLMICRGFATEQGSDGSGDLLLIEPSGRHTVARCLGHDALVEDVLDFDASRRRAERSHGYLVSLDGFSPHAVRLARNLPITLVEAHLLAAWEARARLPQ